MQNTFEKPLYATYAEQSIIGALMIDNDGFDDVNDILVSDDFYHREHQLIFNAICQLSLKNIAFDVITLSEYLSETKQLSIVDNAPYGGNAPYLINIATNIPSSSHRVDYAKIVKKYAIKRQLVKIGQNIANLVFEQDDLDTLELIDLAERQILKISENNQLQKNGFISSYDSVKDTINHIETTFSNNEIITGLNTGFEALDKITSGLQPADLIVIGARPSMGKTALMMNIADNVAKNENCSVAVFSMEMPIRALTLRRIAAYSNINHSKIISSSLLDENSFSKITKSATEIAKYKVLIDDTGNLNPFELRSKARVLAKQCGDLKLIVIDYLQLMNAPEFRNDRNNEISFISRSIKALAKELNIPIILLSQLNRSCENRNDKRPLMSDIRDSGAVEQDADLILFLYRDEVYNKNCLENKGLAELIIAKNRNGELRTINLNFKAEYVKFESKK